MSNDEKMKVSRSSDQIIELKKQVMEIYATIGIKAMKQHGNDFFKSEYNKIKLIENNIKELERDL